MKSSDEFLNPQPEAERLFDYRLRRDILNAIRRELPHFSGVLLDLGCGRMPYKALLTSHPSKVQKYIGLDIEGGIHDAKPDLTFDGFSIPMQDCSVNTVIATEVFEHCPAPKELMREVHRVLAPGGVFFLTVPFFWPLHEVPTDYSRYTPYAMIQLLQTAGFTSVQIRAHGGWDASLAQMLGLWVRYRGMRPWKRRILSHLFAPIVRLLNAIDVSPEGEYGESTMLTGLSATCRK